MFFHRKRLLLLVVCLLSNPIAYSFDSPSTEILISSSDLNEQVLQAKKSAFYPQVLSPTAPEKLVNKIKQDQDLSLIAKEFLFLTLAKQLKQFNLSDVSQALSLLSKQKPVVKRSLNDGYHQQIIIAFPYNAAAKSSLNYLMLRQTSENVLTFLKRSDYTSLLSEKGFFEHRKNQIIIMRKVAPRITVEQAKSFAEWSQNQVDVAIESQLIAAIYAKDRERILVLLQHQERVSLHYYLKDIILMWPVSEQLAVVKKISANQNYASQANYFVEQIAIPQESKIDYWFANLSNENLSASSAHSLSKVMNANLAQRLAKLSIDAPSQTHQAKAILSLSLSKNEFAKQQLKQLKENKSLPDALRKEIR